ncbi:conserved unknown protein [Ectocarpus siliculosus]|uniref:Nickel insertion protein n=1 Tax=Ectocarpus siliculosus TaxID=2880 RepID=D8LBE0_ECTSI|nr:conserved unknown protein [Ectocarpus siliculosus]|eukprot:CBN76649.1 conserved unknown protein [Ectocarpus siliculosus]
MLTAYIDCFSGVAGDMLLAALIDAGAPLEAIREGLGTIAPIKGEWDINLHRVTKGMGSIAAAHVNVTSKYQHRPAAPPSASPHSDHSHGHTHSHGHSHDHSHGHSHGHTDNERDGQAQHRSEVVTPATTSPADATEGIEDGPVRDLTTIRKMIMESGLPPAVKERSVRVFTELGEAEAKTHGSTLDQVHFHEVGAIDSIIDTVGVVYALHLLGIEKVYCSALPLSEGTVWTAHGILPVPAPATLRLMVGLPTCPGPKSAKGELVTPSGAALVRVLSSEFGRPSLFTPGAIGIGAGTKDFDKHPNILRVILGEVPPPLPSEEPQPVEQIRASPADGARETGSWTTRQLSVLEANIDDMTGEAAGYLMEVLLEAGCLDAWLCPILMKKGRPAFTVSVLCEQHDQERFVRLLFTESSTLGVRRRSVERCALRRKTVPVSTTFGDVRVKVAWLDGVVVSTKPEYEDCKVLATNAGVPLQAVTDQARAVVQASLPEEQPDVM